MGDLNLEVQSSPTCQALFDEGFRCLEQLYETRYHAPMPPTCKDSTNIDTALLHPSLTTRVGDLQVLKTKLFDSHDPVIFTLQMPTH